MLASIGRRTGLDRLLDAPLSTHAIHSYKPDPRAYHLAVEAFRLPKERIAFVAHGGWDAAGAAWFGFPTYWINRTGIAREELQRVGAEDVHALPALARRRRVQRPAADGERYPGPAERPHRGVRGGQVGRHGHAQRDQIRLGALDEADQAA